MLGSCTIGTRDLISVLRMSKPGVSREHRLSRTYAFDMLDLAHLQKEVSLAILDLPLRIGEVDSATLPRS